MNHESEATSGTGDEANSFSNITLQFNGRGLLALCFTPLTPETFRRVVFNEKKRDDVVCYPSNKVIVFEASASVTF